ncbi:MAG: GspE/PulE family protein, partial [Telluria sp.]
MNADVKPAAPKPAGASPRPVRSLDLQTVFSWLLADAIVEKAGVKAHFAQAQGILKNAVGSMHPLSAVAQCKLVSAQPPHRLLTLDLLTEYVASKVGLPFIRIDPLKIDFTKVADVMSASYAARFNILPLEITGTTLTVATADPFSTEWETEIAKISRRKIQLSMANPLDIAQYISQFFSLAKSIKDANKSTGQDLALRNNFEQLVELGKSNKQVDANDQHIVNIVDWLWQYAFEQRASDIHLEPKRDMAVIRFRIDGVLHQVYQVPAVVMIAMTARIKLLGRMDVIEKRRPQDGRIKTRTSGGQEVELRLSTMPTAFGEKAVLRIFDPDVLLNKIDHLGFSAPDLAVFETFLGNTHGIILVTGPTGSGKSTTQAAMLDCINATRRSHIITIEDPIEYIHHHKKSIVNQREVGADTNSFPSALKYVLRQDPDVILVG